MPLPEPFDSEKFALVRAAADGALWVLTEGAPSAAQRLIRIEPDAPAGRRVREVDLRKLGPKTLYRLYLDEEQGLVWLSGPSTSNQVALVTVSMTIAEAESSPAPVVRFRGAILRGSEVPLAGDRLVLASSETSVDVTWSALWFLADAAGRSPLRYRSRLVGVEKEWLDWRPEAHRRFAGVAPGSYRLEVQASGWPGDPAGPVATLAVDILSPWWRTWPALAAGALAALTLAGTVARAWTQRGLHRQLALAKAREMLNRERQSIARDMHDDLGASLGRMVLLAERGLRDGEPAKEEALRRIQSISDEMSASLSEMIWAVNPRNDALPELMDFLAEYVVTVVRESGGICHLDVPSEFPPVTVTSERRHALFMAVKESLHNVAKYAGATAVHFHAAFTDGALTLSLSDNGRGFQAGEVRGTGSGIMGLRQRLSTAGGTIQVESSEGHGTRVTLRMPL